MVMRMVTTITTESKGENVVALQPTHQPPDGDMEQDYDRIVRRAEEIAAMIFGPGSMREALEDLLIELGLNTAQLDARTTYLWNQPEQTRWDYVLENYAPSSNEAGFDPELFFEGMVDALVRLEADKSK